MNRGVKLLILLAVVLVVVGGTFLVIELTREEPIPLPNVSGESIKEVDLTQMTGIQWTWGEEVYDFNFDGKAWSCNIQPDYVPVADRMLTILENLKDIRAEESFDAPQDLSPYGLDEPSLTVKVGDLEMQFGDRSIHNDYYYMSMGDGKVYMLDMKYYTCFAKTREEMVQLGAIPDMSALTKLELTNAAGTVAVEYLPQSGRTYSDHYAWFEVGSDGLVNQDVPLGLQAYLQELAWLKCLDSNPQNLADYGLENPHSTCTAYWDGGSYTFYVGNETDQGYFAKPEGENRVYLLDVTTAQVLEVLSADMLACTDVLKMDWSTVTAVDVELDGQNVTINHIDGSWSISSKDVAAKAAMDTLNVMVAAPAADLSTEGCVTELKLTIHRNTDAFNPVTLTFYRLDGTNCVMQLDDYAPMLVPRADLVALKEAFNTVILG